MAEAQFLPSTIYGLDPVSLAGKVAQTNAVIAQTQATRQSMAARAQEMRIRQEQESRAQQQFRQQQAMNDRMLPAIYAKSDADMAEAESQLAGFAQQQQFRKQYQENAGALRDEFIRGTAGNDYDAQNKFLNSFIAKNSYLMTLPEARPFINSISDYQAGVRSELAKQRDFARATQMETQQIEGRKAVAGIGAEAANTRSMEAIASREKIASEANELRKQIEAAKAENERMRLEIERLKASKGRDYNRSRIGDLIGGKAAPTQPSQTPAQTEPTTEKIGDVEFKF